METPDEMRAKVADKAATDADFRARLVSDPKAVIGAELGVCAVEDSSRHASGWTGRNRCEDGQSIGAPECAIAHRALKRVRGVRQDARWE